MADFSKILIPALDGEDKIYDARAELGNALYYQSTDLKGSELGRKIYFSDDYVDLDEKEKELVRDMAQKIYRAYVFKQAVLGAIDE